MKKPLRKNLPEARDKLVALQATPAPVATATAKPPSVETSTPSPQPAPAAAEPKDYPVSTAQPAPVYQAEASPPPAPSRPSNSGDILGEDWVRSQPGEYYTAQIGSSTSEQGIKSFLSNPGLQETRAYVRVFVKEAYRYSALYGSFDSYSAAEQAVAQLPAEIKATKPWIRKFKTVQSLLTQ